MQQTQSVTLSTYFDRQLGALEGLPDTERVKPTTLRHVTQLVGDAQTFIVQTVRVRDQGDTIFLEHVSSEGTTRIVIPAVVADAIARQREALTSRTRSKVARATAQARKDAGLPSGFAAMSEEQRTRVLAKARKARAEKARRRKARRTR